MPRRLGVGFAFLLFSAPLAGQERSERFATLITSKTAETFAAVQNSLKSAPETDRDAVCRWLFRTATEYGWESQLIPEAGAYAQSENADPALAVVADQIKILGLAQSGKRDEAVQAFQTFLRKLRLRSPNLGSDFGQALAMEMQLAGDRTAALAVYEQLSGSFFLNAEVKEWCERRTKRLELWGKPAPEISGQTVGGQSFDPAPLKGKVVLVDFWATNCRPCLEDLPKLREIYAEYHPLGLEIVGVSFDEEETALAEFLERQRLPWTILRNDKQTTERYRVELIPCVVLIDAAGNVAVTDASVPHLRGALRGLLSESP